MGMKISAKARKAILVLCEEVLVVMAVVCLTTMAVSVTRMDRNATIISRTPVFERSDLFSTMVRDCLDEIVESSALKSNFERQGEFYGRKIVDLAEYVEDGKMSGQQTRSVGYKLSDLIHWSRKGLKYKYVESKDFAAADSGMPFTYEEGVLSDSEGVRIELEELYYPVHGRTLFDYANDKYGEEELLKLLEQALIKIREDYQDYKELGVELRSDNTNVRFFVTDYANSNTCSNIDTSAFKEDDTIKTYGQYLILDSRSLEYESNMHVTDSYLFNLLTEYRDRFDGNYYLEFAIDTGYPVMDSLSAARNEYYRYRPVVRAAQTGAAVFLIAAFFCLAALTLSEGSDKKLLGIDRIKTEIAFVFYAGILIPGLLFVAAKTYELRNVRIEALIMSGSGAAVLNTVFLAGYLSLIRRIKAGTLYQDSLTNYILEKCGYISAGLDRSPSGIALVFKELFGFALIVTVNIVLFYLGYENMENGYYFLLGAIDLVIFIIILNSAFQRRRILDLVKDIRGGDVSAAADTGGMNGENAELMEAIESMKEGMSKAMQTSIRTEKLKADLITNVSHDIKTPLTSIINYVGLLKRCDIEDEQARNYIEILDNKSSRLKTLTEDLVEASKITSGNISIEPAKLDMAMMISQMEGEFAERFEESDLTLVTELPEESAFIYADGRRLFRVLDNIYGNVAKYAMPGTRVYALLSVTEDRVIFSLKNISKQALNIDASELTERFIRGDVSRSTEGSGLGLSIAESLTELQKGEFRVDLDGDLFKVTLDFERMK
ncbi:MAG: HAMP domain-containing histidine kinase [Lachnospiraceae bacterium]|nr:HAMP domain-containing histidine kinase [Lachnospiraceae bacterium]